MAEAIKFSRSNFTEADAARLNANRPNGEVTLGMRTAATDALTVELRKAQFANPKEDRFALFMRVVNANPHLTQLVMEPLLVLGYADEVENITEEV